VEFSIRFPSSSGTVDVVASGSGLRKKTLMIAIGSNPFDAGIAGLLLAGISERGEKLIFLQEGSPEEVQMTPGVSIISSVAELPAA